ncbi:hypothetical protein LSTR_LSTR014221 [Laodelphax striatellus]|uniref:Peptidase M13 N-terminal domain-containing protein n=1 Tax=Laodelphax striatellus TaxID=195883 RepID=A0A482XP04_LAOST|nr:hypothetical protein LSTR_LSTR014221 [Laodelphax striatellus]
MLSRRPPIISFFLIIILMLVILMLGILLLVAVARIECPSKMTLSAMQKAAKPEVCLTESCVRTAATLLSAMDQTVSPCDDFFQYACGAWNKKHVIPEDKSSINVFDVLSDQLHIILKGVLEEPSNAEDSSATRKAKLFYKSCMDIKQIRLVGDAPIREVLRSLGGWPVTEGVAWTAPKGQLEILLGRLRGEFNMGWLIEQWVGPDDKNSSVNILQLDQIPLALPAATTI